MLNHFAYNPINLLNTIQLLLAIINYEYCDEKYKEEMQWYSSKIIYEENENKNLDKKY